MMQNQPSRFAIIPTLLFVFLTPAFGQDSATTKALHDLFDREWEYQLQQNPTRASSLGDRRWNDRWGDASLEGIKRRHEHNLVVLAELAKIDRSKLSARDQLNYDLFKQDYETNVEGYKYRWYLIPLNQRGGIQSQDELASSLRFETVKDYEDWIARMKALPTLMDQTIGVMREGIKARMVLPRVIMQRIPAQIDKQIVSNPDQSLFYKPFKRFPASITTSEKERLMREAIAAVNAQIVPSYQRFKQFFVTEYLPATYDEVGVWQAPQGEELYAFLVRRFTTTKMTPREVHERGQSEVRRIRAQMQEVMDQVGFKGTLQEFFTFLRTDKRFYYETPEELFAAYQAISKRIDPNLVKVFKTLPRMPYGVEAIPSNIAPDTTTAYYRQPAGDGSRAGTYFVNLYKPESRPKWEMMALSLHEAVPGHHLQIALAQEQGDIPNFRRYGGYTAFVEGWALYAESLGEDMRLYDDPYAKFGQLTYEMWRAVRLVVDTGMHQMHWTRKQAIDFFMENAPKAELDIINEIDRYIAWPGQALAYKTGELKIKELRQRSKQELGDGFDLREFHDVVLKSGAVPLDVLERNVGDWITQKKSRASK
jgi:prolyl oligopeptidase